MTNRLSERARRAIVYAKEEARRLKHDYIGTEHILLGLIREGEGIAAAVLQGFDLDLKTIRLEVEKLVQIGTQNQVLEEIPFNSQTKNSFELAAQEACELGHNYIGTEHMLLGVAKQKDSNAGQVLSNLGITFDQLRYEIVDLITSAVPGYHHGYNKALVIEQLMKRIEDLENRVKKLEDS